MKALRTLLYTAVAVTLAWGVYAPMFFSLMFLWYTPRFYLMRARAKRNGTFGSPEYERAVTTWQADCSTLYTRLFEIVMCMRIEVRFDSGLKIIPGEPYIVIANHVSSFDTVYFPGLCARLGLNDVRYVVKESFLKYRMAHFVLTRTWEDAKFPFVKRVSPAIDLMRIRDGARHAREVKASMLIFPEGTRSPTDTVGKPKALGFTTQEKEYEGRPIVSLTQIVSKPVGRTMWEMHQYFLKTVWVKVKVHEALSPEVDRKQWLIKEFERMAELVKKFRDQNE